MNAPAETMDALTVAAFGAGALLAVRGIRTGLDGPSHLASHLLNPAHRAARGGGDRRQLIAALGSTAIGRRMHRHILGRPQLVRRLELAGLGRSARLLAGRMVRGAVLGTVVCVAVGLAGRPLLVLAPVGALVGARVPLIRVSRAAKRRQSRIQAQVPELVELLVAGTEAGLPPATAFSRSADLVPGPLGDEVRVAAAQVDLGLPWRTAIEQMVQRTDAPALASMARALTRAHRLGGSVHGSLRTIVGELRSQRRTRAEELARRAPVKMLFPLVFLILPAFLLLTVGPVLLSTVRSLR